MGKGDKKSKVGKLWMGTYGVKRRKKKDTKYVAAVQTETKVAPKIKA